VCQLMIQSYYTVMLCMTSLADPLHTLCLHMYSVFRGAEECDLSVMILETLTRLSPKAFPLVCSHNQLVQSKSTCQEPMANVAMSLKR